MSKLRINLNSQRGFSLIEVVASILIISIILISFLGIFIQTNKTGKASENIVDATYFAQQEMEYAYILSKTSTQSNIKDVVSNKFSFIEEESTPNLSTSTDKYIFKRVDDIYTIKLKVKKMDNPDLIRVIIEVYDSSNDILESKMENIFIWKVN